VVGNFLFSFLAKLQTILANFDMWGLLNVLAMRVWNELARNAKLNVDNSVGNCA